MKKGKGTPTKKRKKARRKTSSDSQPWYGVKLLYQHIRPDITLHTYEERVLIVVAVNFEKAIAKAEKISKRSYESETVKYLGYAMAFNIFAGAGPLPEGSEVFSLLRTSKLAAEKYIDRFHDTGSELAGHPIN